MNGLAEEGIVREEFAFTGSFDGAGPFRSVAVYASNACAFPVMILQPGYQGARDSLLFSAQRMAARGYFCVCNGRRGKAGQPGRHDDGGIEIMDIYDSIRAASAKYGAKMDVSRISISGYSNGGGNVFSALVRFPYLFRSGLALFGNSDYGKWVSSITWLEAEVIQAVGGTPAEVPDKYLARNTVLAAGNLRGVRLHIAYDEKESLCPAYLDEAFVAAARETGYDKVFVKVSKAADQHRWLHGYNEKEKEILSPIEDLFLDATAASPVPPPMAAAGTFTVLGFLVTPRFSCAVGRGDDAVAAVKYQFTEKSARFAFTPVSSNRNAMARVTLPQPFPHPEAGVIINGKSPICIKENSSLSAETTITGTLEFCGSFPLMNAYCYQSQPGIKT